MSLNNSHNDFRGCKITINEVREEYIKSVWILQKFESIEKFELLLTGAGCTVDIFRDGKSSIKLRFFLDKAPVERTGDRYASLYCSVVSGGEGERLTFSLRVVDLDEDLVVKRKEKYKFFGDLHQIVTIQPNTERRRKVLEPKFLRYAANYPDRNSAGERVDLVTSNNIFRIGLSVGWIQFTPPSQVLQHEYDEIPSKRSSNPPRRRFWMR